MTERDLEQSMKIDIKMDVFEGPLDLLLHLIEKNKVSIYDIPIVEITHVQYNDEMILSAHSLVNVHTSWKEA